MQFSRGSKGGPCLGRSGGISSAMNGERIWMDGWMDGWMYYPDDVKKAVSWISSPTSSELNKPTIWGRSMPTISGHIGYVLPLGLPH